MIDPDQARAELDELVATGSQIRARFTMLQRTEAAEGQYWLTRAVNAVERITGKDSTYSREAVGIARGAHRVGGISIDNIQMLVGHLRALSDIIQRGYLTTIEDEVSATDFREFLSHARAFHEAGKKIEASVIAASVFEDTLRKVADRNQIDRTKEVDTLISALKRTGAISKTDAQQFRYYAGLRNAALHASWDEFDIGQVADLIQGTEKLIQEELAQVVQPQPATTATEDVAETEQSTS